MILIKPIVSEKSISATENGKYLFSVAKSSNKHTIKKSVEENYKVNVIKVNIMTVKPEEKIVKGKYKAKIKGWKKAIVTVKKGQKISGFEIKEGK